MRDVLLLVDVVSTFDHEDGEQLAESFRRRHPALEALLESARSADVPVVHANDNWGVWDSDVSDLVHRAFDAGHAGDLVASIAPRPGDRVVVKPRYSAFRSTPLELILEELEIDRIVLAGTATEMCVAQTAIDARESGYLVSVVPAACSSVDERNERTALDYLESVVGVRLMEVSGLFANSRAA